MCFASPVGVRDGTRPQVLGVDIKPATPTESRLAESHHEVVRCDPAVPAVAVGEGMDGREAVMEALTPQTAPVHEPGNEFLHLGSKLLLGHLLGLQTSVMSDMGEVVLSLVPCLGADGLLQRRARH